MIDATAAHWPLQVWRRAAQPPTLRRFVLWPDIHTYARYGEPLWHATRQLHPPHEPAIYGMITRGLQRSLRSAAHIPETQIMVKD